MACDRMRRIVPRFVEGEATPDEALRLARHLSDCTGCRILHARERRLAEGLASLPDPIGVDDDFLRRVMAAVSPLRDDRPGDDASPRSARRLRAIGRRVIVGVVTAIGAGGPALWGLERAVAWAERGRAPWSVPGGFEGWPIDPAAGAAALAGIAERAGVGFVMPWPSLGAAVWASASIIAVGMGLLALGAAARVATTDRGRRVSRDRVRAS